MDGKIQLVRYCEVAWIEDNTDGDRIKVRLSPEDNDKEDKDLDYAFPLLPKAFHIKPKVGEGVFVLLAVTNDGNSQRFYIGPVISQDHRIYNDPYFMGGDSFYKGAYKKFDVAPSMNKRHRGIFPNNDDIMIRGRKNADIQITDDDVRIRAGVKVVNPQKMYKMAFNEKNPSYIKLKYHEKGLKDGSHSTATVVADKINLLSTSSKNYFELTNRDDLITDDEISKVLEDAYKLPYGEKLVDFLITFANAFINHTHDFDMLPPNPSWLVSLKAKKASLLDKKQMLSDTVRIN